MLLLLLLCCVVITAAAGNPRTPEVRAGHAGECVILLHGLGRTHRSMARLAEYLKMAGYRVVNQGYPSTRETVEGLAEWAIPPAVRRCEDAERVHFVTHSLGGILLRHHLQSKALPQGSRIVMLSPPNRGSEVVDTLQGFRLFRWALGPAASQLGTDPASLPNRLKPVSPELGIITGNRSSDPWFAALFEGETDGKVSVRRARLPEMDDFLVVPEGHTFIMRDADVMRQVLYFLEHGAFDRGSNT